MVYTRSKMCLWLPNIKSNTTKFPTMNITKVMGIIYDGKCCLLTTLIAGKKGLQCLVSHKNNTDAGNNLVVLGQNASIQTSYPFITKYVTKCPEQTGVIDTCSTTNPF